MAVPGAAPAQQASAEQIVESMTAAFTAHMQQQQAAAAAQVPTYCSIPCTIHMPCQGSVGAVRLQSWNRDPDAVSVFSPSGVCMLNHKDA